MRIQPTGFAVFPEYDLRGQYDSMRLVAQTGLPVPRMRWLEVEDTSVFGAPFYVMSKRRRPRGRGPTALHRGGLAEELAPADQARIWWGGIESLAAIHQLDWRALGFGFVDKPELGKTGLDQQLAYYESYLRWTARGKPQPIAEAAWSGCRRTSPSTSPTTVWGDARIGNILFEPDGTKVVAVLDWEMVAHGNGEEDLAWAIFLDRHHSEGIGLPRLPGLPELRRHDRALRGAHRPQDALAEVLLGYSPASVSR